MRLLFLALFLFPLSSFAEFRTCTEATGEFGNLSGMRFQVGYMTGAEKCFISLGPLNGYPKYRSFTFDSKGELMVFNSLGPGRPSTDTGARNFLFPVVKSELKIELDYEEEYIRIKNTDGKVWVFDARSAKVHSIENMNFDIDPEVTRSNRGGVELDPLNGTLIDEGWRVGGPPNILLNRNSTVKHESGKSCTVVNKDIFKLRLDNRGRVDGAYFIHDTPEKWNKFLKKNCSHFGI